MKKLIILFITALLGLEVMAQDDITKFLGIPVTGTKAAMTQKLKAKGFTYNSTRDCLEGEFNGQDVYVKILTNNNKVYRIGILDKYGQSENNIRYRFNELCSQFESNKRYLPYTYAKQTIDEDEDIEYEITVNDKRYEADFYQVGEIDTLQQQELILSLLIEKIGKEKIEELTQEELLVALSAIYSEWIKQFSHKTVWFMIIQEYGSYKIAMFYENKYNEANGEDL